MPLKNNVRRLPDGRFLWQLREDTQPGSAPLAQGAEPDQYAAQLAGQQAMEDLAVAEIDWATVAKALPYRTKVKCLMPECRKAVATLQKQGHFGILYEAPNGWWLLFQGPTYADAKEKEQRFTGDPKLASFLKAWERKGAVRQIV